MPRFRSSTESVFRDTGVNITPVSCLVLPLSHCSAIKKTVVNTRGGSAYAAAVFVVPIERVGRCIQDVPFGEERYCEPPLEKTVLIQEENPRTTTGDTPQERFPLTWEQLRFISHTLDNVKRPRKVQFEKCLKDIHELSLDTSMCDIARRQYYAYRNGPLDETELLGLYDAGVPPGIQCTIPHIVPFLPDEFRDDPSSFRRCLNQWNAVTMKRCA